MDLQLSQLTPEQLAVLPALQPPPGVTSNFLNPHTLVPLGNAILVLCLTVTTLLVLTRIYLRTFLIKSWGLDDAASIAAWVGFVGYCAIGFRGGHYGSGVHQWDVHFYELEPLAKLANAQQILYTPLMFITKTSILLLYLRLFVPHHKTKLAYLIYLVILANFLLYTSQMFVTILACIPREKIWNPATTGNCLNLNLSLEFSGIFNVVSDFIILVLPLHTIWHLQMKKERKFQISAVFGFGLFACIASIMRVVENFKAAETEDLTYASFPLGLWTVGELATGIVCGCLPVIPPFFKYLVPIVISKLSSLTYGKSQKSSETLGISDQEKSLPSSRKRREDYSKLANKNKHFRNGLHDYSNQTLNTATVEYGNEPPELGKRSLPEIPSSVIMKTVRVETIHQ